MPLTDWNVSTAFLFNLKEENAVMTFISFFVWLWKIFMMKIYGLRSSLLYPTILINMIYFGKVHNLGFFMEKAKYSLMFDIIT